MINKMMTAALLAMAVATMHAQETIPLPVADKSNPMTLMQALQQRHSQRAFAADRPLGDDTMSQLLWAACGVNRPESKKITAPSAINAQDIQIYVCRVDGAYLYEPLAHQLRKITDKDLRQLVAGRQKAMADAPAFLLLVSDQRKFGGGSTNGSLLSGAMDAGYVSQNICLACTALGLATVPRASMDKEQLKSALGLDGQQVPMINHPVGYPAEP